MLRRLHIRDFVIVDTLELEFESGLTALTGETGAGKSILVDALSLVLGERADASVVRSGAERADISAEFDLAEGDAMCAWLQRNDFDAESCLLRRVVDAAGRSRAYVNGAPATLTQLRQAADFLADIHGQHAHHTLLRNEAQRSLLDGFGGLGDLARDVAMLYDGWRRAREARIDAERNAETNAREREMLTWQVREVSALKFEPGEWAEINQEHKRRAHGAALLEGVEEALEGLSEGELAATWQVERIGARLRQLKDYDPALKETLETVAGAQIQLQEAAHALRHYRERMELDPQRLAELDSRIQAVHDAARKYRAAPEELPEMLAGWGARLLELQTAQDPAALAEREDAARSSYLGRAELLTRGRAQTASAFAEAVTATMQQLAMPGGRFDVRLEPLGEGAGHGLENVEFRVSTHPGQPGGALARVVSGGELSRIGLAVQVVSSAFGNVPTLVFDEVDVGIGGGVAEVVGRLLKQLGCDRQVLCVTHLPQVAAQADWQWSVTKEEGVGGVVSRVKRLEGDARIDEIARMLGGVRITETSRTHAAEMLGRRGARVKS